MYKHQDSFIFFDGNVVIRNFKINDNELITFGFMRCGEYRWFADKQENFTIKSGKAIFIVEDNETDLLPGDKYTIPKGKEFTVKVLEHLDYRCQYG